MMYSRGKYLWESNKKSLKTRIIMLIALSVSFVPITYLWYGTLSELDCTKPDQNPVMADPSDTHSVCMPKASSHWMIFYGVNAMIYGIPTATMILDSSRNRSTNL